ncbi:hypothetical protein [Bradyrhizobium sp. CCGUVB23]|uniref:hypothetical protein n=1 Tax=Bradyrhizobium sp. CCGUVB23 TaxID=2949630 RepID=UPI0020B19198|nr:hypothetical protein [Bradyrhizobium sp. CCGUVB23]MCP3463577.1 hypothetical protein [Bradyrhizobium sp. CCGUVB23]
MTKEKPICSHCGSDDVQADAFAAWSVETQEWFLTTTFDKNSVCEDCGGECALKWVEVKDADAKTDGGTP